jgi:nucleotide-binding universal stress UspA family protein
MFPISQIIAPTDFSEPAAQGLKAAIEMASKFNAKLMLIHVVDTVPSISGTHLMSGANAVQMLEQMQANARKHVENLIQSEVPDQIPCEYRVVSGKPADEIIRLSEELNADLIVIATHGYSGMERFIFGSVAERVMRKAQCPVLSVRTRQ